MCPAFPFVSFRKQTTNYDDKTFKKRKRKKNRTVWNVNLPICFPSTPHTPLSPSYRHSYSAQFSGETIFTSNMYIVRFPFPLSYTHTHNYQYSYHIQTPSSTAFFFLHEFHSSKRKHNFASFSLQRKGDCLGE